MDRYITAQIVGGGDTMEPNEIADTYQALSEYHQLVTRIAEAREEITSETDSLLHTFSNLISDKRGEFGKATASRNQFTMEEYRKAFGDELPTIDTERLTPDEREPLEQLGIIEQNEVFQLPCQPSNGERVHIWPLTGGLNPDYDILQEFTVPQKSTALFHISDTHLGYQNRAKPGGRGTVKWVERADSPTAFETVLRHAIKEDVDAVIHTGDLFDHDVDQETLTHTISLIETLAENGIPFYFILGDHDRLATGGEILSGVDAISALKSLRDSGSAIHCTTTGTQLKESSVALFGIDATNIGFTEIREGYTLKKWSPSDFEFDAPRTERTKILCLHETVDKSQISGIITAATRQNQSFDLVLIGHKHRPPFDDEWQTHIDGVPIVAAGPTIPISNYFDTHPPGYNRIRIGADGNLSIDRRELS